MSAERILLHQGTQHRGRGFTVGYIATAVRASDQGGGLVAHLGIAGPDGRRAVDLAVDESVALPGGGSLRVVDIFVSPDGGRSAAAFDLTTRDRPAGGLA